MGASGREPRVARGCSFYRRFKLSGQFQLSGAKGSPLDKSDSSDALRVSPPTRKKNKRKKERESRREEKSEIKRANEKSK